MVNLSRALSVLILCMTVCQLSWAGTLPIFASVDAATFYTRLGITQHLNLFDNLGNTYLASKRWDNNTTFLVGVGARTYQSTHVHVDTSIRYLPTPYTELTGQIWQLNTSAFHNLSYAYQSKSDVLLLENAIALTRTIIQPSLIFGIGRAVNTSRDYQSIPLNNQAAPALGLFKAAKTTQLAYEVGAALDYPCQQTVIELAYRFMNAGQGYLGVAPQQNTADTLSTGQIQYHILSLGVRLYYDHTV
jgi:hypothetical protein